MAITDGYSYDDISGYGIDSKTKNNDKKVRTMITQDLVGIHGMPFQFLGSVDPRLPSYDGGGYIVDNENFGIGNLYAEKIVARMPLLFLVPCKQVFMDGFTSEEKSNAMSLLLNGAGIPNFKTAGRYYTTEFDYVSYYNHVNAMCRQLAYFMNVQDEKVPVKGGSLTVGKLDWGNAEYMKNQQFKNYFYTGNEKSIVFYVDGMDNLSETMTNSTTESSLASTINSFSDQAKEIKFLLGENSVLANMVDSAKDLAAGAIDSIGGGIADFFASGMLSDLMNTGVHTIINGGKLVFPKIWGDSSFDRSYSFDIKLRSPDHDNLSIFLNIMVPLVHLIALTIPKAMDVEGENGVIIDPNGYISPYLCKAYMKGMFNIDMGMITSLSISRGATAQWNDNGVPTQVDVSITIEDLYSGLFMTAKEGDGNPLNSLTKVAAIASNTAMMDYLSNLGGLNLGGDEWFRKQKVFMQLLGGSVTDLPANIWRNFDQSVNNIAAKVYRSFY